MLYVRLSQDMQHTSSPFPINSYTLLLIQDTVKGVWQMLSHQAEVWGLHAGSKKLHNVRVVQLLQRHHFLPVSTATTGNRSRLSVSGTFYNRQLYTRET
jgi:hypothetical protein